MEDSEIPEDQRQGYAEVGLPGLAAFLVAFLASEGPVAVMVGAGRAQETGEAVVFLACDGAEVALPPDAARGLAEIADHGVLVDPEQSECRAFGQLAEAIRTACGKLGGRETGRLH